MEMAHPVDLAEEIMCRGVLSTFEVSSVAVVGFVSFHFFY
jgi:hypothetical protein